MSVADPVHLLGGARDFSVVELVDDRGSHFHQDLVVFGAHGQDLPPFATDIVLQTP